MTIVRTARIRSRPPRADAASSTTRCSGVPRAHAEAAAKTIRERTSRFIMTSMFHELRYALRTLKNNPSFAAIAMLTLALGIGANTAMFSVVNGVLLRPLDYPNASRIVQVNTSYPRRGRSFPRVTGPDVVDIRAGASALEQVSFYYGGEMGVQMADHAEFAGTYLVTPNFFSIFGVATAFGRGFEGG